MHFGKMSNSKVVRLQAVMLVGYDEKLPEGDREKLLECEMSEGVNRNLPESVDGADLYSLTLAGTNVRALEQTIRITDRRIRHFLINVFSLNQLIGLIIPRTKVLML